MTDLTELTIAEARQAARQGNHGSAELTDAYLAAIDAANRQFNAYVAVTHDKAREMATPPTPGSPSGEGGALEGIPLGIKDLFATEGVHTQACSHVLDGFKPRYESTVTANLWADGAVMLGKLNMDEFAMGSSNETSYYGAGRASIPGAARGSNRQLVPGGSSGGSAAAVAAWLCAGATATDTGGSIRQPAAFTGTVGIKPTYGRVLALGHCRLRLVAGSGGADCARCARRRDHAEVDGFGRREGHDLGRPAGAGLRGRDRQVAQGHEGRHSEANIACRRHAAEIEALWQQGIAWLRDAGAEIVDISLPHTKYALPAYYIVAPAEASSNLARYDGVRYGLRVPGKDIIDMYEKTRAAGFGREVKRRIMIGTYVLSAGYYDAYYLQAQKVRTLIKQDFEASSPRASMSS
jgi:aspartyl-tRNA(Asn)/glutamyl-tRNA(Gln) amidotransferase subunit A